MCHPGNTYEKQLGSLRNSIPRVIPRTNDKTGISLSRENFGHEDLSFHISKCLHISGFGQRSVPGLPANLRIAQESIQILFRLIEKKEQGNDISLENEKIILNATLI